MARFSSRLKNRIVLKRHRATRSPIKGQFFIVDNSYKDMLNEGDRSASQEQRRLRDRLSDDQNAHDLFKGLLGKCNNRRIAPPAFHRLENGDGSICYLYFYGRDLRDVGFETTWWVGHFWRSGKWGAKDCGM
jgi:hypothetical protein